MLFSNVFNRFNVLTALSCFVPVWRSMSFRLGLDEHKVRGEHHQVTWEKPPGQTQALFEQWRDESSELWGARWVRWCPLSGCQCFTVSAPGLLDLQTAADPSKAVPCVVLMVLRIWHTYPGYPSQWRHRFFSPLNSIMFPFISLLLFLKPHVSSCTVFQMDLCLCNLR